VFREVGVTVPSESLKELFLLDPEVTFLNHGSFGACPIPVFETYQRWQRELERQPVEFLGRRIDGLLAETREKIGDYLNCDPDSFVNIMNSTWGVNLIIRSLDLEEGDEVLTTNHEYGACTMAWDWLLDKMGARLIRHNIPLPATSHEEIVESLWWQVTERTEAILVSHITSPTALTLPVELICQRAREAGILTIVDGSHAPGQIPLYIAAAAAEIYTGNFHKWLCSPKGSAFLYVRPEEQGWVESLIISWGWGQKGVLEPSTFVKRNQWQGTRDPSAFLSVPAAIDFQTEHDWPSVRARCHELARETRQRIADFSGCEPIHPDSPEWFAQLVACPIRTSDPAALKQRMYDEFRVEAPISSWGGLDMVRVSYQGYNDHDDLERLMEAVESLTEPDPNRHFTVDRAIADPPPAPSPAQAS
jgi:isopenicillin-N epimerase